MSFNLVKPGKDRQKHQIRGVLWDGRHVKLPGHRDKTIAEMMRRNLDSLNRARALGLPPEPDLLPWIETLSPQESERYVTEGLLERRFVDRRRPLMELLDEFTDFTKANCRARAKSPFDKTDRVRRVLETLGNGVTFLVLSREKVLNAINSMVALSGRWKGNCLSQKTRREYVFAMKSFSAWMVDVGRASVDPFRKMKAPAAKGDPVRNRRPMNVAAFSVLKDYLLSAPERYPHQILRWTPIDRLMIYWAAVMTGFRMNELRSLTRAHVDFQSQPATVTVEGWVAKNGQKAKIPIPDDFAMALNEYSASHHPNAPLFRMPSDSAMTYVFYHDLDAASVSRKFDDGATVDFHTLRSTAIYWWVTESRLHLLDVQCMARLKTLSLVQEYVDNYAPSFGDLVMKAVRLNINLPFKKAG